MIEPAFTSVSEFLSMGGHAVYVWSAWAIGLAVLLGLVAVSVRARLNLVQQLKWQQQKQAMQDGNSQGDKSQGDENRDSKN